MTTFLSGMSTGADPKLWEGLCRGATCPLCLSGKPRDIIAALGGNDEP